MKPRANDATRKLILLGIGTLAFTVVAAAAVIAGVRYWLSFGENQKACVENLSKIDGAKQQWALEEGRPGGALPTWDSIVGPTNYIRKTPVCPSGGTYELKAVEESPTCSHRNDPRYPHRLPY